MSRSSRVRRTNSCWRSMLAMVASERDDGVTTRTACLVGAPDTAAPPQCVAPETPPEGSGPARPAYHEDVVRGAAVPRARGATGPAPAAEAEMDVILAV